MSRTSLWRASFGSPPPTPNPRPAFYLSEGVMREDYWRLRRATNERYREQERERDRRRRGTAERRATNAKYRLNRRAKLKGAFVESVDPIAVFDHNDWTCQICGVDCSGIEEPTSPHYPTVDHIIPFALGGEHKYENTQLLCAWCNRVKGSVLPATSSRKADFS